MKNVLNPMFLCDGYKLDHRRQFPEKTTRIYSNWTPRESRVEGQGEVVHWGLQAYLKKYMMEAFQDGFFGRPIDEVLKKYQRRIDGYLGPNTIGTKHVAALHDLGYIPLVFKSLPEGTFVPLRVPMFTVENTIDEFFWLTNYFESLMSCEIWGPCTSATNAMRVRRTLNAIARQTGTAPEFVQWQGHDFSFRGMMGADAAAMSGSGHLLFFTGTDTLPSMDWIEEYYGVDENYLLAGSVAATEHSVMCAGSESDELKTFNRLLDLYKTGILSVVSDTWDLWKVITEILPQLRERILARDGKLVIRPDSGNPADIICGDQAAPEGSPASKGVVELLWEIFGGTTTSSGLKLLDPHIGSIYGDAITNARAKEITDRLAAKGFASGNIVFGVGSFTYQYVTRDTFGFAMKATWAEVDGVGHDLFKDPVTDNGVKKSAKGRLSVLQGPTGLYLVNQATPEQEAASLLQTTWKDGAFVREERFAPIRERALAQL